MLKEPSFSKGSSKLALNLALKSECVIVNFRVICLFYCEEFLNKTSRLVDNS